MRRDGRQPFSHLEAALESPAQIQPAFPAIGRGVQQRHPHARRARAHHELPAHPRLHQPPHLTGAVHLEQRLFRRAAAHRVEQRRVRQWFEETRVEE